MDTSQQSHRIVSLQSEFNALVRWVDPAEISLIHAVQHERNMLRSRLKPLTSRRSYLTVECERVGEEVDGCHRALELTEAWTTSEHRTVRAPGQNRIRERLVRRANEVVEFQRDLSLIDEQIAMVEIAIDVVQTELLASLELAVGGAEAARSESMARLARARESRLRALLDFDPTAMWSPVPIIGYRVWSLTPKGFAGHRSAWSASTFTASCSAGPDVPHTDGRCADVAFGCGIYVARDLAELLEEFSVADLDGVAVGLVAMSGKVVEHEHGYRAESTKVTSLAFLDESWITFVEGEAGTATVFASRGERMKLVGYQQSRPKATDRTEAALVRFFEKEAKEADRWI